MTPIILHFDRVSKWYGPVIGLNQVSFALGPGITGLVGPNGAGKSTLMKLATGQLAPSIGSVSICQHPARSFAARLRFGCCPDVDTFYEEMTGRDFVRAMALLVGYRYSDANGRTSDVLEAVAMSDDADRRIGGYSKGQRQRIKLAQALLHDPTLLVLDEPLNGVDPVGRSVLVELFERLAGAGKCLLISSHQLEELERLTDQMMVVARGRLVAQGTAREIRTYLDTIPSTVRIETDRPRELAGLLLAVPQIVGVDLQGPSALIARVRDVTSLQRELSRIAIHESITILGFETLDSNFQALLDYLLDGRT